MTVNRSLQSILVTGGCGFIGSNFIRCLFAKPDFTGRIINLDALTYAGNPFNLVDIDKTYGGSRYFFVHGDITDPELLRNTFSEYDIDTVVHFAAESHVDRSIHGPAEFIKTNVMGTFLLLEAAREHWQDRDDVLFHHVSTDEVYGSLGESGKFSENSAYDPRSPYSASKAGSDHLVSAYCHTYNLPITVSNCSNNYGPYQFPEKLIPLMILNMDERKPLPVYGDGLNVRDWVHVDDHNEGVWQIINAGKTGTTYNIGGGNEQRNIDVIKNLCAVYADLQGIDKQQIEALISYVKDRPGHDRRYAIDSRRIRRELGWEHSATFTEGLKATVRWYLQNKDWVETVRTGEYRRWLEQNYEKR